MKELISQRAFLTAMDRFAGKVAIRDGDYEATYAELGERVLRLTDAMHNQLGLRKDDRFAVMSANSHQFMELYHAAFLGGGIINPLNLRLAGQELQHILADSGCRVVFVDSIFAEHLLRNIEPVRADLPIEHIVLIGDGEVPRDASYEELVNAGAPVTPTEVDEDDPVLLMYTGGTTGLPKGALLTQRAEILNMYHIGLALGFDAHRVYLHQTPMFHAASMGGVLGIPAVGGESVFIPLFEPGQALDAMERHGVTWTMMVPTMLAMLLDHPDFSTERLAAFQDLVYGASPMPPSLLTRTQKALPHVRLWQGYGMTESSSVLTFLTAEDHERGGDILRSAGRTVVGVDLTIQDPDGNILPPMANGEVCVRAGNLMREYWRKPEQTDHAFRGGWYHTGDEGHVDHEGYVYLVDRVNDMIITGGENVYSIEVENAISTHPAVDQVAVIGIPHDVWGEQVHAIVVPRAGVSVTAEDIQEHARQTIAGYKVPKSVELRAEALPLSGALKPLKRELRRPYWEEQDLTDGSS
jgi:long-chain acyl-CoA synthetase